MREALIAFEACIVLTALNVVLCETVQLVQQSYH